MYIMLEFIEKWCNYVYKIINDRFSALYDINKSTLEEENMHYCKMSDGGFNMTEQKIAIQTDDEKKRKDRLDVYR